jgi:long-chain acyl-CoA synthetase
VSVAPTLIGLFLDAVEGHRKPIQFMSRTADGWQSISADRAHSDVECLALALRELGVQHGDRVALLSESRYEWPITDLAVVGLGAVTAPIYPTLTAEQCRRVLENSEAMAVVASDGEQLAKIREAARGLAHVRFMVVVDEPAAGSNEHSFAALLERGAELRLREPNTFRAIADAVQPSDLATLIYTSGTTGEPKGAMLTHDNITSNVAACLQFFEIRPDDVCLSFLPLCHIFERMGGLYAMLAGGATIAYAESIEAVARNAIEVRPTVMMGVPRFYEKIHARVMENAVKMPWLRRRVFEWGLGVGRAVARGHFARRAPGPWLALQSGLADRLVGAEIRKRVGGRLRFCISGGAPLASHVMEFFFAVGIPIYEGYGLTETSPVICLNPSGRVKLGSVGRPIPGVEVKIAASSDFPPGPEGRPVGEILTRGPHVMQGYFRNEAATREALRDGWFHTGDVGYLDDENYLFITDRLKDLLVTAGGKKVAPQPIEASLKHSRWIAEAVLLGDGRPYIVALLVPNFRNLEAEAKTRGWTAAGRAELLERPEVQALYQAAVDHVNAGLAPFQTIKRFTLLERELTQEAGELTPTLKVKRRVIVQRFGETLEKLYARPASAAA